MRVYRAEIDGKGPYTVDWPRKHDLHGAHTDIAHLGMGYIIGDDREDFYEWYSACPTIDDLKVWFEGFWYDLLDWGFSIVEVEVDDMDYAPEGLPQVAYHKDSVITKRAVM